MAASTRNRVARPTRSGRFRTLDTVPTETPASAATSLTLVEPIDTRNPSRARTSSDTQVNCPRKQAKTRLSTLQDTRTEPVHPAPTVLDALNVLNGSISGAVSPPSRFAGHRPSFPLNRFTD